MTRSRILNVEDEAVAARDIREQRLSSPLMLFGAVVLSCFVAEPAFAAGPVTGVTTTLAGNGTSGFGGDGGAATAALLDFPSGVAVDGAGNVYVADNINSRIRKVTVVTGVITTVAGGGTSGLGDGGPATAAQLNHPWGVALDVAGNLYIGDTNNHRIRK
jgi:NHL repeat-containing protein